MLPGKLATLLILATILSVIAALVVARRYRATMQALMKMPLNSGATVAFSPALRLPAAVDNPPRPAPAGRRLRRPDPAHGAVPHAADADHGRRPDHLENGADAGCGLRVAGRPGRRRDRPVAAPAAGRHTAVLVRRRCCPAQLAGQ